MWDTTSIPVKYMESRDCSQAFAAIESTKMLTEIAGSFLLLGVEEWTSVLLKKGRI